MTSTPAIEILNRTIAACGEALEKDLEEAQIEFITNLKSSCEESIRIISTSDSELYLDDTEVSFLQGYKNGFPSVFICEKMAEGDTNVKEILSLSFKNTKTIETFLSAVEDVREDGKRLDNKG